MPAKAPRPAAGSSARPPTPVDEPPTRVSPVQQRPPVSRPPTSAPPPPQEATQATDIIAGRGAKASTPSHDSETRAGSMAAIHAVPTTGDRIGKYVVDKLLGSGGMGLVVSAKNQENGETVAIKLLRPKAAGDRIHAERFAREARAIMKITSEHVVKVLDTGTLESDAPFIVMEYLVGRDLSQTIREDGALSVMAAADIMLQVCDAVASAHSVGVIHRDLKPSNFFLSKGPNGKPLVKVLDFGIAKAIGTDGVVDPNLTETQAVFGSPTYMSPEQIRSAKHIDHRSDIWSIGVALYEVTTGRLPFAADNVAGLLASIVADPPYYPRAFVPDMPTVFEELLLACLHKDPKQRVQTAGDLGVALAPFATPGPDTEELLASIVRLSPPTGQAFPGETGPRLPSYAGQGGVASSLPGMNAVPNVGPVSSPSWPGYPPEEQRTSGVAFGSTGSDLHAVMPKPVGKKIVATLGIALAVAVVLLAVLSGAYYYKRPAAVTAVSPPKPVVSAPASASAPVADVAAPAVSSVSTAPAVSAPPVVSAAVSGTGKKPLPRGGHGSTPKPAGPAPASAPAPAGKPVDPTNDRF